MSEMLSRNLDYPVSNTSRKVKFGSGNEDFADDLLDLYQRISLVKAGHDEKSMSVLATEWDNMPSLRRRVSGKLENFSA